MKHYFLFGNKNTILDAFTTGEYKNIFRKNIRYIKWNTILSNLLN